MKWLKVTSEEWLEYDRQNMWIAYEFWENISGAQIEENVLEEFKIHRAREI